MEDGNNFGVSIQKDCIKRLTDAQEQMEGFMELMTQYYKKRGDAVALVLISLCSDVDGLRAFHHGLSASSGGDRYIAVLLPQALAEDAAEHLPVDIRRVHEESGSAPEPAFFQRDLVFVLLRNPFRCLFDFIFHRCVWKHATNTL